MSQFDDLIESVRKEKELGQAKLQKAAQAEKDRREREKALQASPTNPAESSPTQFPNAFSMSMMTYRNASDIEGTMSEMACKIHAGDLSDLEAMLVQQAYMMNDRFGSFLLMAGRTTKSEAQARLMGVALRCQEACRKTAHTLGELKNPKRVTFIKQQLNQLIQDAQANGSEKMDNGAAAIASGENPTMEAVAVEHWAEDGGRQEESEPEFAEARRI